MAGGCQASPCPGAQLNGTSNPKDGNVTFPAIQNGPIDVDIERRMAQVVGTEPRVHPLSSDQLSPEQIKMIEAIRGSIGSGMASEIPEFFRTTVKHPHLFRCQMEAGTMYFTGTIPPRQRELSILRIAWLCRAPYEWGEHVDIAKRYGVLPEEIERVTQGSTATGWSKQDAALLSAVEELLGDHAIADATWSTLSTIWSEQQLLEFPMLVGAYISTALQQNTLRMRLAQDNPGLSHR